MNNGIQFNGDGPMMSGTWYNPQTGHKFTVRDSFFEDGNFIVMATNGQRYDYNTIQNYIQCNDANGKAIEPDSSVMAPKSEQATKNLPPEVANILENTSPLENGDQYADLMVPEDIGTNPLTKGLTGPGLGNLNDQRHIAPASEHTVGYMQVVDENVEDLRMIDRVLKRHPIPEFDAQLNWSCPTKQIETLVDVLGIEPKLIAEYYVSKLDQKAIFEGIIKKLAEHIKREFGGEAQATSAETIKEPEIKSKAKTPKKLTKSKGK